MVLDTAAGQWLTQGQAGHGDDVMRRCRHAMASVGPYIFVHGGLKGSTLLEDVLLADDSSGAELSVCDPRSPAWQQWINSMHGSEAAAAALANAAAEEAAAAAALSMRRVNNAEDLRCLDEDLDENMRLNKVRSWAVSLGCLLVMMSSTAVMHALRLQADGLPCGIEAVGRLRHAIVAGISLACCPPLPLVCSCAPTGRAAPSR